MVELIDAKRFVDDRGQLDQIFDKLPFEVKRIYTVQNHKKGTVRAWHKNYGEWKGFYVIKGAVKICVNDGIETKTFVLSEQKPQLLIIEPEIWNGNMALTDDAIMLGITNTFIGEHMDERKPSEEFGNPWDIKNR
ncbi:WxcM-like domain-containing protein [Nanoarchaeota archaeon]